MRPEGGTDLTTIEDLAAACGVSIATVSRAFSPNATIKPATREKILRCAQELHYVPNSIAKSLQQKQTNTIGLIIPDIGNAFYISVLRRMDRKFRESGYRFIVGFYQSGTSTEAQIISDMYSYRVDGLIFTPRGRSSETVLKQCFSPRNVLQLFGSPYPEYDSLDIDDVYGAHAATEYLISQGHKKILYYGGGGRVEGYFRAMEERGLSAFADALTAPQISEDELRGHLLTKRPTAILTIAKRSEQMVSLLNRMGWKFPDDVSLIVYDDVEWTGMLDITTVTHPLDDLANIALEMLLARLRGNAADPPAHRRLLPLLKYRNSVKSLSEGE